ncbi:MAG: aminodeoxychorismate lyase [Gammaproteobacteria bacterium]
MLIDGFESSRLDADDRGLAYGDGLFETLALSEGRVLALDRHLERLARGAERLGLAPPPDPVLREEIDSVCRGHTRGVLKIILTRGSGGRGYRWPNVQRERRIVSLYEWPRALDAPPQRGAFLCRHPLSINPAIAGIKHLNRLDQVLASRAWPQGDYVEGLMLDGDGHVIEGTRSNLFLVLGRRLITPCLERAGVAGIVRAAVIERAARLRLEVIVKSVLVEDLLVADELFVTNSIIGVHSIDRLDADRPMIYRAHAVAEELVQLLRHDELIP